jgi:fatty-acyl-CoA synthase
VTVAVYPVPDARTGDQVMAALELNCAFDPEDFATFLRSQPDLGTKWAPRYVRLIAAMPLTGTNKVDKQPLRAEQWLAADPVFFRPARDLIYRPMTDADRAELRAAFAEYERLSMLP